MSKILITGGAGFVGVKLARSFVNDGNIVHLVDNLSRGNWDEELQTLVEHKGVEFHNLDLLTPGPLDAFCDNYDYLVHLSAIVGVQNVLDRPYETLRSNVVMHDAAIRFARQQKQLRRFLFTSTSEVYAGSLLHSSMEVPTPEEIPIALPPLPEPRSTYMLSKIYGEAMLQHSGLPFTIVRPHNVYGPRMGMSHVIPQLLQKAHGAEPNSSIEVFSVEHRRSFCFISDAVEMLRRVLFSNSCLNQTFNLGAEGPEITIKDLAERIIDTVGKPLRILPMPATPGSPSAGHQTCSG